MLQRLRHGEGIHFLAAVLTGFNGGLQIVASDLFGKRVCDDFACATLVFLPRRMWQSDPHRLAVGEKLDVHGVGVARGDSNDEALVEAVNVCFQPAILGVEIFKHDCQSIAFKVEWEQTPLGGEPSQDMKSCVFFHAKIEV